MCAWYEFGMYAWFVCFVWCCGLNVSYLMIKWLVKFVGLQKAVDWFVANYDVARK
jgi:hypothetical protein